jgi:hypothetical protein
LRNFLTAGIRCFARPCDPALYAAFATPLNGSGVFPILYAILNLAGRDIDDELPELDWVARALETTGCHAA